MYVVLSDRTQAVLGCVSRSIETTGAALGLDKLGINVPKVHRNLSYGVLLWLYVRCRGDRSARGEEQGGSVHEHWSVRGGHWYLHRTFS